MALDKSSSRHKQAVLQHTEAKSWDSALQQLHSIEHAPKLLALQQLLFQCGIGEPAEDGLPGPEDDKPGHRVLVFAQYRALLDIVEADVMRPLKIPFLRLDGR